MNPPSNQRQRATPYVWSEQMAIQLFMVINEWQVRNAGAEFINWTEVCTEFRANTDSDLDNTVIKNKFDNDKSNWRLWNSFRYTLEGALIDPVNRRVVADERWWAAKIRQNFKFRNFKKGVPDQQLSILMDEVYHRIPSCHEDPFAPLNPPDREYHEVVQPHGIIFGSPSPNVNPSPPILPSPPTRSSVMPRRAETLSNNGAIRRGSTSNPSFNAMNETLYNQYDAMNNQLRTEGHMIDDLSMYRPGPQFTRLELGSGSGSGGSRGGGPARRRGKSPAPATSNDSKSYKQFQKIRNIYSKRIDAFKKRGDAMLDALESELFSSSGTAGSLRNEHGFKSALVLINDMVLQNLIVEGSPLWCFAVSFIRNPDNRTAFRMLGSHMLRLTWIESEFNRATQFELQL